MVSCYRLSPALPALELKEWGHKARHAGSACKLQKASPEPAEGTQPGPHLDLIAGSDLQTCKMLNFCCFKSLVRGNSLQQPRGK